MLFFLHAEENCIVNAAKNGTKIDNSILFVTGYPCFLCLRKIINAGIKRVVYGDVTSKCVDEESKNVTETLIRLANIEMIKFNFDKLNDLYNNTTEYIKKYATTAQI